VIIRTVTPYAILACIATVAVALPAANALPDPSGPVYTAADVILCSTLDLDRTLQQRFNEFRSGAYPGHETVQGVANQFKPGGTLYNVIDPLAQALHSVWLTADGTIIVVLTSVDQNAAAVGRSLGGLAGAAVQIIHDAKCLVAWTTYDIFSGIRDCWLPWYNGPGYQWIDRTARLGWLAPLPIPPIPPVCV
jgi:hypothetical protein